MGFLPAVLYMLRLLDFPVLLTMPSSKTDRGLEPNFGDTINLHHPLCTPSHSVGFARSLVLPFASLCILFFHFHIPLSCHLPSVFLSSFIIFSVSAPPPLAIVSDFSQCPFFIVVSLLPWFPSYPAFVPSVRSRLDRTSSWCLATLAVQPGCCKAVGDSSILPLEDSLLISLRSCLCHVQIATMPACSSLLVGDRCLRHVVDHAYSCGCFCQRSDGFLCVLGATFPEHMFDQGR